MTEGKNQSRSEKTAYHRKIISVNIFSHTDTATYHFYFICFKRPDMIWCKPYFVTNVDEDENDDDEHDAFQYYQ